VASAVLPVFETADDGRELHRGSRRSFIFEPTQNMQESALCFIDLRAAFERFGSFAFTASHVIL
jgi:hypothetical protein